MLKHWQTHAEYQQFISEAVALLNPSQLKKLHSMSDSWEKLTSLNLDPVGDFLAPFYSATERQALNQPQILRSFILMLDRKFTSPLIQMEHLCMLPDSAWFTGDTVRNAMTVNGVVRLPVEKRKSARAKSLVPLQNG